MQQTKERTLVLVKPDGFQRGLTFDILRRFHLRNFKLVAMKLCRPGKAQIETHYAHLRVKPNFVKLVEYMTSGPLVALVLEGDNCIRSVREILGAAGSGPSSGTIRGDYCLVGNHNGRNVIHASDSVNSAKEEIPLWFRRREIIEWDYVADNWVSSKL